MPASTDWDLIAKARGFEIPETELERVIAPLRLLEQRFRPLAKNLSPAVAPAILFRAGAEESE